MLNTEKRDTFRNTVVVLVAASMKAGGGSAPDRARYMYQNCYCTAQWLLEGRGHGMEVRYGKNRSFGKRRFSAPSSLDNVQHRERGMLYTVERCAFHI